MIFIHFSKKRLLGVHVPYVIEAYPENNMRHLSAESALYCRIFMEGLLGFEQTGFHSFDITPQLPREFDDFSLSNIHMDGIEFSIDLKRTENNRGRLHIYTPDSTLFDKTVQFGEKITVGI